MKVCGRGDDQVSYWADAGCDCVPSGDVWNGGRENVCTTDLEGMHEQAGHRKEVNDEAFYEGRTEGFIHAEGPGAFQHADEH